MSLSISSRFLATSAAAASAASASTISDGDVNENPRNASFSFDPGVPLALSTAGFCVHMSSKHAVHISPSTVGRNGGVTSLISTLDQFTPLKNLWFLTFSVPLGPLPMRTSCRLSSSVLINTLASPGRKVGILSFAEQIAFCTAGLFLPLNGSWPVNISYIKTPTLHQSAVFPCPFASTISGAM